MMPRKGLLTEADFASLAEVAGAIPVVEEYLAKAVMTNGVVERMPGVESLILKEKWVFDGEGFGLCCARGI